ncbi:uroporphyrinogen-III synthase [Granulicella paludicola]|uniref:uroporphyrinogen-III synthase n=1 Tax=Granulicella paludicola TaxID=474951 RepID=UPI0021E02096|nr:uroporphyrinogen-III synthase [Granulicella paludicola]
MAAPRILVTRSPHQASPLADALRALGLEPILIPTIELAPPTTFAPLDEAIATLDTFHWLLFTSANAVEAFAERYIHLTAVILSGGRSPQPRDLEAAAPTTTAETFLPLNLRVAAIGPATARALEPLGLNPDLIPEKAIAESLAESLLPHALQPDGTPTRFLLIRAESARDHLPDTLRAAGAVVTIAPAYRTITPADSIAAIQHLFSDPSSYPDAITFTSSSTVTNLLALLEVSSLSLPFGIPRISIGPITSKTLTDLNLSPHTEASEPTIPALADAVRRAVSTIGS